MAAFPVPHTPFSEHTLTNALVALLTAVGLTLLQDFILGI